MKRVYILFSMLVVISATVYPQMIYEQADSTKIWIKHPWLTFGKFRVHRDGTLKGIFPTLDSLTTKWLRIGGEETRFARIDSGKIDVDTLKFFVGGKTYKTFQKDYHPPVTLAGQNYLTLSGQQITAGQIDLGSTHVTGTLAAARFGALTGDVTSAGGTYATTIAAQNSAFWSGKVTDETGTGAWVFANSPSLTAPTIAGGTHTGITSFGIRSTGTGAFDLKLANTENLTADRTLTIAVNDANRTLTLSGNATLSGTNTGDVTLAGQNYLTLSGQQITAGQIDLGSTHVTGTLAAARFGALTGDVTSAGGTYATTIAAQNSAFWAGKVTDETGTGAWVFANSPTLSNVTLSGFAEGSVLFAGSGGLISQNNSQLFWDNTNGRLGIGTTAPVAKLEVNGDMEISGPGSVVDALRLHKSANADRRWITWLQGNGADGTYRLGQLSYDDGLALYRGGSDPNLPGTILQKWNYDGNVGIGTTAPVAKLEVNGDMEISGPGSVVDALRLHKSANADRRWITWLQGSGTDGTYRLGQLTYDDGLALYRGGSDPNLPGTILQKWNYDGNVGIGTTSPNISDGTGLHVAGKIIRIGTSKTPASATAAGNTGEICWDANYVYVCVAPNTWKRAALTSW